FMEQGASLALDGDLLRVIPRNDIYIRYLNDNRASIGELASELYGRKLRVEVSLNGGVGTATDGAPAPSVATPASVSPAAGDADAGADGATRSVAPSAPAFATTTSQLAAPVPVSASAA